jgi:hypothetical protein
MAVIQSGRHIGSWPGWARVLSILVIGAIAVYLFRLPREKLIPIALVTFLIFFAAQVIIFSTTLSWNPPFVGLSLFALMLVIGAVIPGGGNGANKTA